MQWSHGTKNGEIRRNGKEHLQYTPTIPSIQGSYTPGTTTETSNYPTLWDGTSTTGQWTNVSPVNLCTNVIRKPDSEQKCRNKNNIKTGKSRRSNKKKNRFKNFCIYYNNVRGIKSKLTSLTDIVAELNPHVEYG